MVTKKIVINSVTNSGQQWFQYLAGYGSIICMLSFGLHYSWSSPSIPILLSEGSPIPVTLDEITWITSVLPLSNIVGALLCVYFCDTIGRKSTILFTTIPHFLSWILIAYSTTIIELFVARFLAGIAEGIIFLIVPIYICEITEPGIRGKICSGIIVFKIIGILGINVLGSYCTIKTTALIAAVVPIITLLCFVWMPESPYYFILKKKYNLGKENLKKLRGNDIEEEFNRICKSVENQMENPATFSAILTIPENRKAWYIMVGLRFFSEMSGNAAITYYLIPIFKLTGIQFSPILPTIIFFLLSLFATFVCSFTCDRFGRVPLLMVSMIGASLSLFIMGVYFFFQDFFNSNGFHLLPLICLFIFIITFSYGYGTIPAIMSGELFAANVKSKALCLVHFIFALSVFISSKLFWVLESNIGVYTPFWMYSFFAFLGIFYAWIYVPETKGKTLEEIQNWMKKK